jgi:perosamine synthetase
MNIDPKSVEERITKRTKAIYAIHLGGHSADMDPLVKIAKKHKLFLLGDNAQSPGALYKNRFVGTIEDIGVFSLNCHKTIQSGEGGIAVTNDADLALKLQLVRNHGEKCTVGFGRPDIHILGQNYRMTEMEAAVAFHQLHKLKKLNAWRQDLAAYLTSEIQKRFDFIEAPHVQSETTHVYYIYLFKYFEEKAGLSLDLFSKALNAEGIHNAPHWATPIYHLSIYQDRTAFGDSGFPFKPPFYDGKVSYAPGICPVAEEWEKRSICIDTLARWPNTKDDMDLMIKAIEKIISQKDELIRHGKGL